MPLRFFSNCPHITHIIIAMNSNKPKPSHEELFNEIKNNSDVLLTEASDVAFFATHFPDKKFTIYKLIHDRFFYWMRGNPDNIEKVAMAYPDHAIEFLLLFKFLFSIPVSEKIEREIHCIANQAQLQEKKLPDKDISPKTPSDSDDDKSVSYCDPDYSDYYNYLPPHLDHVRTAQAIVKRPHSDQSKTSCNLG